MSYLYKTESPKALAAVRAWDEKKAAWNAQREKLGQVFGAAAGHRELYGMAFLGDLADNHERALAQAMTALGEDTYELLFRRGQAMTPKEIVTLLAQ